VKGLENKVSAERLAPDWHPDTFGAPPRQQPQAIILLEAGQVSC